MEKLSQYFSLFTLIATLAIVVLLAIAIYGLRKILKSVVTNKFASRGIEEVDVKSGHKTFSLIVANKSVNDAAISAIGIVAGRDYFDFADLYRRQHCVHGEFIVIPSRAPIKLSLDIDELERLVFSSFKNGKFRTIGAYVIDGSGNVFVHKAKDFNKIMRIDHKAAKAAGETFASPLPYDSAAAEKKVESAIAAAEALAADDDTTATAENGEKDEEN